MILEMMIKLLMFLSSSLVVSTMFSPTSFANTEPVNLPSANTVTVKPGQSLWKIAQTTGTTVAALEASNPTVNPSNLQVGTMLQLPQTQYTVRLGDTLWLVARKFIVSEAALQAANPAISAANLLVGTRLAIPARNITGNQLLSSTPSSGVSSSELSWMARIISAEARGESYNAQVGVGDVVWHRMLSPQYPDTVKSVVFQVTNGHYQFTPVRNGSIYNAPTTSAVQAAKAVLVTHRDLVPGSFVFYTPSKTPANSWVRKQPTVAAIGAITFAK